MNRSVLAGFALGSAVTAAAFLSGRPVTPSATAAADAPARVYENTLTPLADPKPLLADFPQYVEPVVEERRFEAPRLVDDPDGDLDVRAWRFSYNARGIVEVPNRLRAKDTAMIVVHPWSVDDDWGWRTPQPNGAVDFCTPTKNALAGRHTKDVIDPFLKRLRGTVGLVGYSLIGPSDPVRRRAYRTIHGTPTPEEQAAGKKELRAGLAAFKYDGNRPLPAKLTLSADKPVADYFRQFPGLDAGAAYNGAGFWQLPIAVTSAIETDPNDLLICDQDGYPALRDYLKKQGVRHVLLTGYATDMCFCKTTAGYQNLAADFNVFLVGDATLATFPANATPRFATNAHISFAAIDHLVTQVNWVRAVR